MVNPFYLELNARLQGLWWEVNKVGLIKVI